MPSIDQEIFKTTPLIKHLKFLIKKYTDDVAKANNGDQLSSFNIIEFDEPLCCILFETEYARKHLDHEFLLSIIYHLIVECKIHDPELICKKLIEYIHETERSREWVSIFPLKFTGFMLQDSGVKNVVRFGRFALIEPQKTYIEFKETLSREFGIESVSDDDYAYCAHEKFSGNALRSDALLAFESCGSEENRNFYSIAKFNYFCRIFEVFSVNAETDLYMNHQHMKSIHHAFFVNKHSGSIDKKPLNKPSRISPAFTDRFHKYATSNNFELFANRIFYIDDKIFARIRSALYFFSKAYNDSDHVMSFLSYIIATESLFSRSDAGRIKEKLARYISNLCYAEEDREDINKLVKTLYKQRSNIVHSGKFDLRGDILDKAKNVAAKAILSCLKLHKHLLEENSKETLDSRYFKYLDSISKTCQ